MELDTSEPYFLPRRNQRVLTRYDMEFYKSSNCI